MFATEQLSTFIFDHWAAAHRATVYVQYLVARQMTTLDRIAAVTSRLTCDKRRYDARTREGRPRSCHVHVTPPGATCRRQATTSRGDGRSDRPVSNCTSVTQLYLANEKTYQSPLNIHQIACQTFTYVPALLLI